MSTRGFIGFVVDGTEKIAYNHYDSYPGGLGIHVLDWLHSLAATENETHLSIGEVGLEVLRESTRRLRVLEPGSEPTDEDIERLKLYTNTRVGERRTRPDWYQLLSGTQGKPAAILYAGAIEDASEFPLDSLFAEWGYVVDLDALTFEVYKGFQTSAHTDGRFADRVPSGARERARGGGEYHPCRLVASWPLSALPADSEFMAKLEPPDEDDEDAETAASLADPDAMAAIAEGEQELAADR